MGLTDCGESLERQSRMAARCCLHRCEQRVLLVGNSSDQDGVARGWLGSGFDPEGSGKIVDPVSADGSTRAERHGGDSRSDEGAAADHKCRLVALIR